jgi:hypothetical protein
MMGTRPSLPLMGGCSCGAIRYEIASFPLLLYTCNCTDCQRASGSAFALNMPVATKDLHFVKGTPKGWHHLSPSGVPVVSWFCADCGARLYGERSGRPDSMNLRAGTLDDTTWLMPAAHIFLKSAQPWLQPPADAECYDIGPDDFRPLAAKWRAQWPEFFPKAG